MRIGDEPQPRAEDVAALDVVRLVAFTVSAGAGDEIDAGRSRRVWTSGSPAPARG